MKNEIVQRDFGWDGMTGENKFRDVICPVCKTKLKVIEKDLVYCINCDKKWRIEYE